jgi:acetyltransferase
LVHISNLAAAFPEIRELDLNPIVADENGISILDARIAVAPVSAHPNRADNPRFAIRPYPHQWVSSIKTRGGVQALIRPVRPEDEPLFAPFLGQVSPEDLRLRFFAPIKDFGHEFVARLTQIDYDRAMAFLAIDEKTGQLLAVARLASDPQHENAEYAILVRTDLKGRGLGWAMRELLIRYAGSEGFKRIEGQVLKENVTMLQMCRELGFSVEEDPGDAHAKYVSLPVADPSINA